MFEILDRFFVRLGCPPAGEGPQIAALSGFGIFLPRVQTILAGFEFSNHWNLLHERESISDSLLYECGWLSQRHCDGTWSRVSAPNFEPVGTRSDAKRHCGLLFSAPRSWRASAFLRACGGNGFVPCDSRVLLFQSCWQTLYRGWAAAVPLRLGGLWKGQSRSPAGAKPRHAFLPVRGASPHARILQLACWGTCLHEHLHERVLRFLFRA